MIIIFSFIPKDYIKYDNNHNPTISLFSSIKTSILNQTYTNWELLLVTNVENVLLNSNNDNKNGKNNDPRIKIVYTSDSYLNLNTLFALNNGDDNNENHRINPGCKYISFFDLENDVWNVNKLQIQYNLMASSDYDVIGCETTHSTQSISSVFPRTIKKSESSLFTSCPFLFSTALIKRELFRHYHETILHNEYEIMNDRNFTIIHSENNTLMSQFHNLLLYLTLVERNVYCIHHSHNEKSNNNNNSTAYIARIINSSLVETSSQNKLIFFQEHKTCDHLFLKMQNSILKRDLYEFDFFLIFAVLKIANKNTRTNAE